jgi:hypothetical protein
MKTTKFTPHQIVRYVHAPHERIEICRVDTAASRLMFRKLKTGGQPFGVLRSMDLGMAAKIVVPATEPIYQLALIDPEGKTYAIYNIAGENNFLAQASHLLFLMYEPRGFHPLPNPSRINVYLLEDIADGFLQRIDDGMSLEIYLAAMDTNLAYHEAVAFNPDRLAKCDEVRAAEAAGTLQPWNGEAIRETA